VTASQIQGLYIRELTRLYRNPAVLIMTFVQPFMWLAFFGSSFSGLSTEELDQFFHTNATNYIQFLLPGVLATSQLTIGMFASMSTIQDKRFGYMKRILLTPTAKGTVFFSKVLGATTRGLIQIPIMVGAALAFGVRFPTDPVLWLGWIATLFLLGLGFTSLFMAVTASSTDWQTPGVVSNFITMPLMFSSAALFPQANFPQWMLLISHVNPITYAALFGRAFVLGNPVNWTYLGYVGIFAVTMLAIGTLVSERWLKVE
jgi:ABC-2 type transport system permease protein